MADDQEQGPGDRVQGIERPERSGTVRGGRVAQRSALVVSGGGHRRQALAVAGDRRTRRRPLTVVSAPPVSVRRNKCADTTRATDVGIIIRSAVHHHARSNVFQKSALFCETFVKIKSIKRIYNYSGYYAYNIMGFGFLLCAKRMTKKK